MTRRLRAFRRWMRSHSISSSDALDIVDTPAGGIAVRALRPLREDDVIATIPKAACLTIKTSAARGIIEEAEISGAMGLSLALMYERSLGMESEWSGYLQVLPEREEVPLVWSLDEVDELLAGTELHKTIKEDKTALYEDWKESIEPLILSGFLKCDPKFFAVEQYLSVKSLVASRSFMIDDYHDFGMVPLADLFNHKTGAENVHFTCLSSPPNLDDEGDGIITDGSGNDMNNVTAGDDLVTQKASGDDPTALEDSEGDPETLEMIIVRGVEAGDEVFNTYGSMGNAALLHRYGFTEINNPFDIVNIDLNLVSTWSSSSFSPRHSRARMSLWRKLGFSGCMSQNSEYFEVSYHGEPQLELLALVHIVLLRDDAYEKLTYEIDSFKDTDEDSKVLMLIEITTGKCDHKPEDIKVLLLTRSVCSAILSLADMRESLYGSNTLEDDIIKLKRCCILKEKKLHHSLVLRVSERTILAKLRAFASRCSDTKKRKNRRS